MNNTAVILGVNFNRETIRWHSIKSEQEDVGVVGGSNKLWTFTQETGGLCPL